MASVSRLRSEISKPYLKTHCERGFMIRCQAFRNCIEKSLVAWLPFLLRDIPALNEPDPTTFYGGDAAGYTSYPELS
jgi:hypothetical protein